MPRFPAEDETAPAWSHTDERVFSDGNGFGGESGCGNSGKDKNGGNSAHGVSLSSLWVCKQSAPESHSIRAGNITRSVRVKRKFQRRRAPWGTEHIQRIAFFLLTERIGLQQ
jgi:hypothetical protein